MQLYGHFEGFVLHTVDGSEILHQLTYWLAGFLPSRVVPCLGWQYNDPL